MKGVNRNSQRPKGCNPAAMQGDTETLMRAIAIWNRATRRQAMRTLKACRSANTDPKNTTL